MGINLGRLGGTIVCSITDLTYCTPEGFILIVCEQTLGIMVACVPTLGPIFFPRNHSGSLRRNNGRLYPGVLHTEVKPKMKSRYIIPNGDDDAELLALEHSRSVFPAKSQKHHQGGEEM